MTIIAFGIVLLTGISLLLGWYFRSAEAGILESEAVWKRLSANVNRLVADESFPHGVAKDMTLYAAMAGCGCIAIRVVADVMFRNLFKSYREKCDSEAVPSELRNLTDAQRQLVRKIMDDLIFYDALQMPLIRPVMRLGLLSSISTEKNESERDYAKGLHTIMSTAHEVAQRRLRQHRIPNQDLIIGALSPAAA